MDDRFRRLLEDAKLRVALVEHLARSARTEPGRHVNRVDSNGTQDTTRFAKRGSLRAWGLCERVDTPRTSSKVNCFGGSLPSPCKRHGNTGCHSSLRRQGGSTVGTNCVSSNVDSFWYLWVRHDDGLDPLVDLYDALVSVLDLSAEKRPHTNHHAVERDEKLVRKIVRRSARAVFNSLPIGTTELNTTRRDARRHGIQPLSVKQTRGPNRRQTEDAGAFRLRETARMISHRTHSEFPLSPIVGVLPNLTQLESLHARRRQLAG